MCADVPDALVFFFPSFLDMMQEGTRCDNRSSSALRLLALHKFNPVPFIFSKYHQTEKLEFFGRAIFRGHVGTKPLILSAFGALALMSLEHRSNNW